jgi:hypothetical protein
MYILETVYSVANLVAGNKCYVCNENVLLKLLPLCKHCVFLSTALRSNDDSEFLPETVSIFWILVTNWKNNDTIHFCIS